MATIKSFLIAASCGVALLGAVSAHAAITANALNPNALNPNALTSNALNPNGLSTHQSEGLPFNGLSQKGLGKTNPQPKADRATLGHAWLDRDIRVPSPVV